MAEFFNSSNCPGTDVILELLRAEHEQVKQRTEIIVVSFIFAHDDILYYRNN